MKLYCAFPVTIVCYEGYSEPFVFCCFSIQLCNFELFDMYCENNVYLICAFAAIGKTIYDLPVRTTS